MKTSPVTPDDLARSVIAVPPLARHRDLTISNADNRALIQYLEDGGVRTLQNNGAHAAGNATTQMLVVLRDNPKVRLLFTLVDGNYRIVAKRSAGISKLADLKGKRVVTPRATSARWGLSGRAG